VRCEARRYSGGAGLNEAGSGVPTSGESTSTMSPRMGGRSLRSSSCSALPTLKSFKVRRRGKPRTSRCALATARLAAAGMNPVEQIEYWFAELPLAAPRVDCLAHSRVGCAARAAQPPRAE
jgi:hypothetical protein